MAPLLARRFRHVLVDEYQDHQPHPVRPESSCWFTGAAAIPRAVRRLWGQRSVFVSSRRRQSNLQACRVGRFHDPMGSRTDFGDRAPATKPPHDGEAWRRSYRSPPRSWRANALIGPHSEAHRQACLRPPAAKAETRSTLTARRTRSPKPKRWCTGLRHLLAGGPTPELRAGGDMAILYRNPNAQSRRWRNRWLLGHPTSFVGGLRFYDRARDSKDIAEPTCACWWNRPKQRCSLLRVPEDAAARHRQNNRAAALTDASAAAGVCPLWGGSAIPEPCVSLGQARSAKGLSAVQRN